MKQIVLKLDLVNKFLDYELSPAGRSFGLWDHQIQMLYDVRDRLLTKLRVYRR